MNVKASKEMQEKCKEAANLVNKTMGQNIFKADAVLQAVVDDLANKDPEFFARIFKRSLCHKLSEKRKPKQST